LEQPVIKRGAVRWTFEQVLQSMRELDAFLKRLGLYTEAGQTLWSMTEAIELAGVYAALKNYDPLDSGAEVPRTPPGIAASSRGR
jgi:hypothetical protein